MSNLVIVESPAKAKTLGRFLGQDYTVMASKGHVRDLARGNGAIDVEADFATTWEVVRGAGTVVKSIKSALGKADTLYLATDPDREGEAISWHLLEALGKKALEGRKVHRVVFHEITEAAVTEAFDDPRGLDEGRVDSYLARRILDRLMGYPLSGWLWTKITSGLSAGRVQSVVCKMVVDREREIRAFIPAEYWMIAAEIEEDGKSFIADLRKVDGKTIHPEKNPIPDEKAAGAIQARLSSGPLTVASVDKRDRKEAARPPFRTSTLQGAASSELGFTPSRTMRAAQKLYAGVDLPGSGPVGLITYMRTDSFHVAGQAIQAARRVIESRYGDAYLPSKPNYYQAGGAAQEAHEAIRPTDPFRHPQDLKGQLPPELWKLYDLIWRRFIASQMPPARFMQTTIKLERDGCELGLGGRVLKFPGHLKVRGAGRGKDQELPELEEGQELTPTAITKEQKFTSPPRRYSEASLVKAMEEDGIGRPSTYAPTIDTLFKRAYVDHGEERSTLEAWLETLSADREGREPDVKLQPRKRKGTALYATFRGEVVTDFLMKKFDDIVNEGFTAQFEELLDEVARGDRPWRAVVEEFNNAFTADLEKAKDLEHYRGDPILLDETLAQSISIAMERDMGAFPVCGKDEEGVECTAPMAVLFGKADTYCGCSAEQHNTMPLGGKQEVNVVDLPCPICEKPLQHRKNRWGNWFLGCEDWQEKEHKARFRGVSATEEGEPIWVVTTPFLCPGCEGREETVELVRRVGKRGPYLACTQYRGNHKRFLEYLGEDEPCPTCEKPMAVDENLDGTPLALRYHCPSCGLGSDREADPVPTPKSR